MNLKKNYENDVQEAQKLINFDSFKYQITLETSMGDIVLDMFSDIAPGHCKNMIGLAKLGFYDNLTFHRIIPGFVIQGGCPIGNGTGGPGYTIDAEFNDVPHEAGVLSMARTSDPNSAGSQFFLCLDKVPYLDNQYTVFGKTADEQSTAAVRAIGDVKTGQQDRPVEDIVIKRAVVNEIALT